MENIAEKIAVLVKENGGRTFYVGGFVRDRVMGTEGKDVDIEVHGITPEKLREILANAGTPLSKGESFGVYGLSGYDIDIAMPRSEHATGRGHKDFEIFVDPFIGTEKAAKRRDFTMNALMQDVLTGELIDHFGGISDIENRVIRHIDDESFVEDPLRVFRASQFSARLGFEINQGTIDLCSRIDVSTLSRERVEEELKKALLKGERPSEFFSNLRKMNQLGTWFPEMEKLIGLEQDPVFHPEGDVWTHTLEVLDRAAGFRDEVSNPYAFMILSMVHDFGKIITTEEKDGRIHAYGHETLGLPIIEEFLQRVVSEKEVKSYVRKMVPLHMKPNVCAFSKPKIKSTNRMFDEAADPKDLIYFAMADKPVMSGDMPFSGDSEFLFERYDIYMDMMARPYVTGQDLIDSGLSPGEGFSEILDYAHKLRLAGTDKENALKQCIAYAGKR